MSWFEKLIPSRIGTNTRAKGNVPEGLWVKCEGCATVLYCAELERAHQVCEKCGKHMRMYARARIKQLMDTDSYRELDEDIKPVDVLKFRDSKRYRDRLTQASKDSGEKDALIVVTGNIAGIEAVVAVFDFRFMGGSMGSVVGEKFARAGEYCIKHKLPFICFSASGGARMQEALFSLLQMGKTSSTLAQLSDSRLPFISVLTDPTMGGVSASLAMLGDVIIAEPGARIGFAGPRVIEQTVREKLPEGFQSSEFLLEHGAIDMIVDRRDMRETLGSLLAMLLQKPEQAVMTGTMQQDAAAAAHPPQSTPATETTKDGLPAAAMTNAEQHTDTSSGAGIDRQSDKVLESEKSSEADNQGSTTDAAEDADGTIPRPAS